MMLRLKKVKASNAYSTGFVNIAGKHYQMHCASEGLLWQRWSWAYEKHVCLQPHWLLEHKICRLPLDGSCFKSSKYVFGCSASNAKWSKSQVCLWSTTSFPWCFIGHRHQIWKCAARSALAIATPMVFNSRSLTPTLFARWETMPRKQIFRMLLTPGDFLFAKRESKFLWALMENWQQQIGPMPWNNWPFCRWSSRLLFFWSTSLFWMLLLDSSSDIAIFLQWRHTMPSWTRHPTSSLEKPRLPKICWEWSAKGTSKSSSKWGKISRKFLQNLFLQNLTKSTKATLISAENNFSACFLLNVTWIVCCPLVFVSEVECDYRDMMAISSMNIHTFTCLR